MIVFNKYTGNIIAQIPDEQNVLVFFQDYPSDFKEALSYIKNDYDIKNLGEYKVVENQIIKRSKNEVWELRQYGKTLSDEERAIEQLKPSYEEIKKAENTIEILSLLQEVM